MSPARSGGRYGRRRARGRERAMPAMPAAASRRGQKTREAGTAGWSGERTSDAGYAGSSEETGARGRKAGTAGRSARGGGARRREEPRPERSEAAATGRTAGEKRAAEGERSDARRRACAGERGGARGRSGAKRTRRRATAGAFLLQHHQHHKPSELRAAKERASRQASEQRERGKLSSRISFPKS